MFSDNKNSGISFPVPTHPHLHSLKANLQNLSLSDHLPHYHRLSNHGKIITGPLLRYINIDYQRNVYRGSCLIVSTHKYPPKIEMTLRPSSSSSSSTPSSTHHKRHYFFRNSNTYCLDGEALDTYKNEYTFWRYGFELPLTNETQIVSYTSEAFYPLKDYHA
ncbi:unnamed protein product [Cunninghamella echinulata]